jgi:hypothetical protein
LGFLYPLLSTAGATWQLDRDKLRSAYHLRPSIRVCGGSRIGEMTDQRFQNQNELFGKHGDEPPLQIAGYDCVIFEYSLVN